jgi:hypothetical protein
MGVRGVVYLCFYSAVGSVVASTSRELLFFLSERFKISDPWRTWGNGGRNEMMEAVEGGGREQ